MPFACPFWYRRGRVGQVGRLKLHNIKHLKSKQKNCSLFKSIDKQEVIGSSPNITRH
jgi:hypothetical protein